MSRKDFILIAETILNLDLRYVASTVDGPSKHTMQRTLIAEQFADVLGATNGDFKRALFIQAATGIVPVTARKARS